MWWLKMIWKTTNGLGQEVTWYSIERIKEVIDLVSSLEGDNCPQILYFREKILSLLTEGIEDE